MKDDYNFLSIRDIPKMVIEVMCLREEQWHLKWLGDGNNASHCPTRTMSQRRRWLLLNVNADKQNSFYKEKK